MNNEAEYWKKQYRIAVAGFSIIILIMLIVFYLRVEQVINTPREYEEHEKIQNLCIGWADHIVNEKESYSNSFATNVLQQKYWIAIYEKCMEGYK